MRPAVQLTGTVKDCDGDSELRVSGVTVEAFDKARNPQIIAALETLDTTKFDESNLSVMTRFGEKYSRLMDLLENVSAITGATSDSDGKVTLNFRGADSVVIVGHADLEDVPYYWAYTTLSGRTSSAFVLDMSRGECKYEGR
jgi:hypothetical protein